MAENARDGGARLAIRILEELKMPYEQVEHICRIVDGHDTRNHAISPEDAIVKDSDKLYRYTPDGQRFVVEALCMGYGEYRAILKTSLESWFFTPTARQIATEEMKRFMVNSDTK